jgi:fluoroquinolone transport system permease protein
MFLRILKHEFRGLTRDRMYAFFMIYPIILAVIAYFLIPYLRDLENSGIWPDIIATLIIVMTSFIYGAVTGFSLLDDKDDKVFISLKITPINVRMYVFIKLLFSYILGVLASILLILATNILPDTSFGIIMAISLVSAIQGPFLAMVMNSFATNKVEGFVVMKGFGMVLILPLVAFVLTDWTEFFIAIAPGFWPTRMVMMELLPEPLYSYNLNSFVYFTIGMIYNIVISYGLFKVYMKRTNI